MMESIAKCLHALRQITYKNVETDEMDFTNPHSLALEAEEMEIRPPPIMRSYQSDKTIE